MATLKVDAATRKFVQIVAKLDTLIKSAEQSSVTVLTARGSTLLLTNSAQNGSLRKRFSDSKLHMAVPFLKLGRRFGVLPLFAVE